MFNDSESTKELIWEQPAQKCKSWDLEKLLSQVGHLLPQAEVQGVLYANACQEWLTSLLPLQAPFLVHSKCQVILLMVLSQ